MKTITKTVLLLFVLTITTSCFIDGFTGVKGNSNVISEERTLSSNFNEISVQQGIKLHLTEGDDTKLTVETDENILELLITEVKNNELKIYFEKNVSRAKSKNVYLTASDISKIETSSGASVISENTLQSNMLDLDSSSGSFINLTVNATAIKSEASSGSSIKIIGKTTSFSANASSGSSIKANKLKSEKAIANASSGASIDINVSQKLKASASSGGHVDYDGSPTEIDKDASSGGRISGS